MRAAEVIKRNGRELQEHRHLGCANGKKEEPTKVEKERGGRQESGASWRQRAQKPEKKAPGKKEEET